MTNKLPRPRHSFRTSGLPSLLVVALVAIGCGVSEESGTTEGRLSIQGSSGPIDTSRPTVGKLDPDLLDAVQAAARDALDDGVRLTVTSGWRSRSHQQRLFAEGVIRYGSEAEASRWVSTPDNSKHVTGDAVDIGPTAAAGWLSRHGAEYGLCQTFANEIWHYELTVTMAGRCPEMLPDSSYRN